MKKWRLLFLVCVLAVPIRGAVPSSSHLEEGRLVLPPFAHAKFCLSYPRECQLTAADAGRPLEKPVALTPRRRAGLADINGTVNAAIQPQPQGESPAREQWKIGPRAGDCNDYAVTKRHDLITLGWPARALPLVEVALPTGEHHLVLVARTDDGDFVLDNLAAQVEPLAEARDKYRWLRMEVAWNPKYWATVKLPS